MIDRQLFIISLKVHNRKYEIKNTVFALQVDYSLNVKQYHEVPESQTNLEKFIICLTRNIKKQGLITFQSANRYICGVIIVFPSAVHNISDRGVHAAYSRDH